MSFRGLSEDVDHLTDHALELFIWRVEPVEQSSSTGCSHTHTGVESACLTKRTNEVRARIC